MVRRRLAQIKRLLNAGDPARFYEAPRPHDPADYARPILDGSGLMVADFPRVRTAPGASLDVWAPLVMPGVTEPLAPGVPDLRGVWEVYEGRMLGHVERIEQAGNRIVITTGGLVHDMICDGTLEHGVDDIAGFDGGPIRVAADFDDGVHKLRPNGKRAVAVTRRLEGDRLRWRYGAYVNMLYRLDEAPMDHPATRAAAEDAGFYP